MTEVTGAGSGIGVELTRARETRGLALSDVAQQLKFSVRQLEALEQERFDTLPGGTFARGMVRSYARLLKLDADALLERLGEQVQAVPQVGKLADRYLEPVPFSDSARRSTFVYLGLSLGVLAIGSAVAWEWYRERSPGRSIAFAPAKTPSETKRTAPKAVKVVEPAPAASTPAASAQAASVPAASAPVEAAKPVEAVARPPIVGRGPNRLVLRFEQEAWAEVKDGAERLLISSLNPAGTERSVRGQPPFSIVIGNAQHVQVIYNDKPVDLQPFVKVEVARFTLQ